MNTPPAPLPVEMDELWSPLNDLLAGAVIFDGLDDAVVGYATLPTPGREAVLAYDENKIIQILVDRDGMDWEEAREFYEFNIESLYAGPRTPVIINRVSGAPSWVASLRGEE